MTGSADAGSQASVFDSFGRMGMWNLPGHGSLLCGRIEYSPDDGTLLHTMGFTDPVSALQGVNKPTEAVSEIKGIVETGEHVLLSGCHEAHRRFSVHQSRPHEDPGGVPAPARTTSITNATYRIMSMYMSNAPLPSPMKFSQLYVSYTSLFTWLNEYSLDIQHGEGLSTTIKFTPPAPRKTALPGGMSITIAHSHSITTGTPKKEFVLPQSAAIGFEAPSPAGQEWFMPHIRTFGNFLMMGTRQPVQPETLQGMNGMDEVRVFPPLRLYKRPDADESVLRMHFNYQQIAGDFDAAIASWFRTAEKYSKSMEIYFHTRLEGPALATEIRFLRLAQAIEAFYRAKHPGAETTLEEMVARTDEELPYDVFSRRLPKGDFASSLAAARHYISHGFLPNKEKDLPEFGRFVEVTERADLLLYGCYLDELEISGDLKQDIMKKRQREADQFRLL